MLTGNFDRVNPRMLNIDLWTNTFMQMKVAHARENGDCPCCKHQKFDYLEGKAGSSSMALCGRDAVQLRHKQQADSIDFDELAFRLQRHGSVKANDFILRANMTDNETDYEITLFRDGRAIVKGTNDVGVARGVYAKYIGS